MTGGRSVQDRRSQLQILAQPPRLRAAHRDFRRLLVLHPQDVVPAEPRDDLLDLVDVHEMRSMHPPENGRVEPLVQFVQRTVAPCPRVLACHYAATPKHRNTTRLNSTHQTIPY